MTAPALPAVAVAAPAGGVSRPFDFGAIGDTGFTADARARFPGVVADMNAAGLAFSVGDGYIGEEPDACTDGCYASTRNVFHRLHHWLVYTPERKTMLERLTKGRKQRVRMA